MFKLNKNIEIESNTFALKTDSNNYLVGFNIYHTINGTTINEPKWLYTDSNGNFLKYSRNSEYDWLSERVDCDKDNNDLYRYKDNKENPIYFENNLDYFQNLEKYIVSEYLTETMKSMIEVKNDYELRLINKFVEPNIDDFCENEYTSFNSYTDAINLGIYELNRKKNELNHKTEYVTLFGDCEWYNDRAIGGLNGITFGKTGYKNSYGQKFHPSFKFYKINI